MGFCKDYLCSVWKIARIQTSLDGIQCKPPYPAPLLGPALQPTQTCLVLTDVMQLSFYLFLLVFFIFSFRTQILKKIYYFVLSFIKDITFFKSLQPSQTCLVLADIVQLSFYLFLLIFKYIFFVSLMKKNNNKEKRPWTL